MSTPTEALFLLRRAAADGRLDAMCEDLGVRLLGAFGSTVHGSEGRSPDDLDLAVSLDEPSRLLEVIDAMTELTDCDRIDLVVLERSGPVMRAEALCGEGLYERTASLFATSQMSALAERRDTAKLRALDLRALAS